MYVYLHFSQNCKGMTLIMPKSTDRRSLYTQKIIKESFLHLLQNKSFETLSISSICKEAGISRPTFYLHYPNTSAVLDSILQDTLLAEGILEHDSIKTFQLLESIAKGEKRYEQLGNSYYLLPACQRIADKDAYRAIFMDSTLSNYIISKIFHAEKDKMIPYLMQSCFLDETEASLLFNFILQGSFAVNQSLKWKKNQQWNKIQTMIIQFVLGGIQKLQANPHTSQ